MDEKCAAFFGVPRNRAARSPIGVGDKFCIPYDACRVLPLLAQARLRKALKVAAGGITAGMIDR